MTTPKTAGTASPPDPDLAAVWERWWTGLDETPGEIAWDASPGDLEADLHHFAASFGPALPWSTSAAATGGRPVPRPPLQHRAGHRHIPRRHRPGRAAGNPPNGSYQVLDARHPGEAARLHHELGNANVYVRGVLQALPSAGRPQAAESIRRLLGATGALFAKDCPRKPRPISRPWSNGMACPRGWPR
jgi:hypothetical protein